MNIVFYSAPRSSASPVHSALVELDVPHERIVLDLQAGDQRKPSYEALNPNCKVPLLVVDGQPMFEAVAIMMWLGEQFGVDRGLWPATDDPRRLAAWSWCVWAYVSYGSAIGRLHSSSSPFVDARLHHAPQAERARSDLHALLDVLEKRLTTHRYMLGDSYTLCDLVVASVIGYGARIGAPVDSHPHVAEWLQSFQRREAFRAAP